jgi:hypothetical protein
MLNRFDRIRIQAAVEQGIVRQRELQRRDSRFRSFTPSGVNVRKRTNATKLRHGAPQRVKVRS